MLNKIFSCFRTCCVPFAHRLFSPCSVSIMGPWSMARSPHLSHVSATYCPLVPLHPVFFWSIFESALLPISRVCNLSLVPLHPMSFWSIFESALLPISRVCNLSLVPLHPVSFCSLFPVAPFLHPLRLVLVAGPPSSCVFLIPSGHRPFSPSPVSGTGPW